MEGNYTAFQMPIFCPVVVAHQNSGWLCGMLLTRMGDHGNGRGAKEADWQLPHRNDTSTAPNDSK